MKPHTNKMLVELQRNLKAVYGTRLTQTILYGSQARGDSASGSDFDVLVVLEGQVRPGEEIARTGEVVTRLSLKYDQVISCAFVSADRYQNERSPLFLNVRREGIAL